MGGCAFRADIGGESGAGTVSATYANPCEIDLDFGSVPVGLSDTATIEIDNAGLCSIELSHVYPTLDPEFSLDEGTPQTIQPGKFGQLKATFQPYKTGQVTSSFTIPTDGANPDCPTPPDAVGGPFTVSLTGAGIQLSLVVEPSSLDFGNTQVNTTAKKSVTHTNSPTAAVTRNHRTISGGDANLFVVDNAPTTLGPGDAATVDISATRRSRCRPARWPTSTSRVRMARRPS